MIIIQISRMCMQTRLGCTHTALEHGSQNDKQQHSKAQQYPTIVNIKIPGVLAYKYILNKNNHTL